MTLVELFKQENCTDEEKIKCWEYLQAIRIIPVLEDLKKIYLSLNHVLKTVNGRR